MSNLDSAIKCSDHQITFKTIEEFGYYIQQEDQKLVESKLRKYSLIDSEGNVTTSFYTPKTSETKTTKEIMITQNDEETFKSPLSIKINDGVKKKSIFSSGAKCSDIRGSGFKEKPIKIIPNPFRNESFKKRLKFSTDDQ